MKTGERVNDLGLYASECCGEELIFDADDTLLRCPRCSRLCLWDMEEQILTHDEFERVNGLAA